MTKSDKRKIVFAFYLNKDKSQYLIAYNLNEIIPIKTPLWVNQKLKKYNKNNSNKSKFQLKHVLLFDSIENKFLFLLSFFINEYIISQSKMPKNSDIKHLHICNQKLSGASSGKLKEQKNSCSSKSSKRLTNFRNLYFYQNSGPVI
jgi:hypothetical protein